VTGVTAFAEDRPLIGTKRGEMYPDFALPSLDGDVKRLSDYRGKRILLLHFASW
jgi:peroxiredoxin